MTTNYSENGSVGVGLGLEVPDASQMQTTCISTNTANVPQIPSRECGSGVSVSTVPSTTTTPLKKRGGARKELPAQKVDAIWALSGLGRRPKEIAQILGIHIRTIHKYLDPKYYQTHPGRFDALQSMRANVSRAFASRLAARGVEILDSISPDEVKALKPNARAVVGAILVDKAKVLDDRAKSLDPQLIEVPEMPTQRTVKELVASIASRFKSLTILNIEVPEDTKRRVEALEVEYEIDGCDDKGAVSEDIPEQAPVSEEEAQKTKKEKAWERFQAAVKGDKVE